MDDALKTEYPVSRGKLVSSVTAVINGMFLFMAVIIPWTVYYYENDIWGAAYMIVLMGGIFAGTAGGAWYYSPKKYTVSERAVTVIRPAKNLVIPIDTIEMVEDKTVSMFKTLKTFGNGGYFSFSGSFYNKQDGKFVMSAKNANYVMIHADKKYVLSPDEKDRFILDVQKKLERHGKPD